MARPEKNNVEYFPFLCKEGKAMFYIENKYGNDGYATWVKILRELAVTNNHYLNLSDPINIMYLASKCRISEQKLIDIITDLSTIGEFSLFLWMDNRIVFNEKFVQNIQEAYKKRTNECIDLRRLLLLLDSLGIRKLNKIDLKAPDNPHSIVDDTKLDDIRLKNITPLDLDFELFWIKYDKKVGRKERLKPKWDKLSIDEKQAAMDYIPKYKIAQPDKQYRKNPETFLNQKSWNDELIFKNNGEKQSISESLTNF